jgi:hypothetical protein
MREAPIGARSAFHLNMFSLGINYITLYTVPVQHSIRILRN